MLSIQAAESIHSRLAVGRVLNVLSLLAPSGAGRVLLLELLNDSFGLTEKLNNPLDSPKYLEVLELIPALVSLSILQWDESGKSVKMHRLIGRVVRDRMVQLNLFAGVIATVSKSLPRVIGKEEVHEGAEHALSIWGALKEKERQLRQASASSSDSITLARWAIRQLALSMDYDRAIRFGNDVLGKCQALFGYSADLPRRSGRPWSALIVTVDCLRKRPMYWAMAQVRMSGQS